MFTRSLAAAAACAGFLGIGYNRRLSFETQLVAMLRGSLGLLALVAGLVLFLVEPALAQASSSAAGDAIASTNGSFVSIVVANVLNPLLEAIVTFLGLTAVTAIVQLITGVMPGWLKPFLTPVIQSAIAHYVVDGLGTAVQKVEDFDKGKTVNLDVGSSGVATAFTYVLNEAPDLLIKLAGGKDAIISKIIAFAQHTFGITLDSATQPEQVAAAASAATAG